MITARISILNLARGNYTVERSNGELGRNVGGVSETLSMGGPHCMTAAIIIPRDAIRFIISYRAHFYFMLKQFHKARTLSG
jgi:hypothetical protein